MRRTEVIEKLNKSSKGLAEQYGIKALFLFGSVARDEGSKISDVDLLVEFIEPIGLFDFVSLKQELEKILGCPVDLGTMKSLKGRLEREIDTEAIRVA